MKRVVYELVTHGDKTALRCVRATMDAFRAVGFACRMVGPVCCGYEPSEEDHVVGIPALILQDFEKTDAEELWVLSDTLMGPALPLDGLIAKAYAKMEDAWRLTQGAGFFGLKRSALAKPTVQNWLLQGAWTEDAFCSAIDDAGLQSGVLYDTADMANLTTAPLLDEPVRMLQERGCPFFMHEVFHRDYGTVIDTTLGHMGMMLYAYLRDTLHYNVKPLWDYLLANYHQVDLFYNLHLQYTLSTHIAPEAAVREHLKTHRLALAMHLYYDDLLAQSRAYVDCFPPETEVFITTDSQLKKQLIEQAFADCNVNCVEVRVIQNRGRDVSALLIGLRDLASYDYVCFFHDKKVLQTKPGTVGIGFAYQCVENLFATPAYVLNVVDLMARNPQIGLLSPPAPNHSDYFFTLGMDWGPNWDTALRVYQRLQLHVPISQTKMPIAPLGTCFWFRGAALAALMGHPWRYEDFPPEPNATDGTVLHAVERIYPFAAQEAGFCPAYICSDRFAALEYTNLRYYVRGFQRILVNNGMINRQQALCKMAQDRLR